MRRILRILLLLLLGYLIIGITIVFVEERLSEFEDAAELREFEQIDILDE